MQIVLAKTEEDFVVSKHGRVDLGERNTFTAIKVAKSLMWLNDGNDADIDSARTFADREGYTVFCYQNEKDPLTKARKDIMTIC